MRFERHAFVALLLFSITLLAQSTSISSLSSIPTETMHWRNSPAEFSINNGALTIKSHASTDWFISPIDGQRVGNSPVLLFPAAKDFSLSAKVTVGFQSEWDAGVLAIYLNDTNWTKFCFEMSTEKRPTIVSVVTRGVSDDSNSVAIDGNSVFLKIAKSGPAIFLYTSRDGKKWNITRAFNLAPDQDLKNLQIGFSSQSPHGAGTTAVFSEISYKPERVANLFAGE